MLLKSSDGSEFEASIAGYEFPEIENDNWLLVFMRVKSPRGEGAGVDPCLHTWDVESLIKWLEALANNDPVEPDMGFPEPNMLFKVIKAAQDRLTLRVYFILESESWWKPAGGERQSGKWHDYVDLDVSREDMQLAAEAWRADLSRFPTRYRKVMMGGAQTNSSERSGDATRYP